MILLLLLLLLRKETREREREREERECAVFSSCESLQQRERAKKSPEKLAKLSNKTYDIYLNRERERERNFFLFFFVDQQTNEIHEFPHSVTRDFRGPGGFLGPRSVSQQEGSLRGEKKGKKEEKQSAQTRKKNKKPISLHFNNALVLFTRVRNNKRANVS